MGGLLCMRGLMSGSFFGSLECEGKFWEVCVNGTKKRMTSVCNDDGVKGITLILLILKQPVFTCNHLKIST